MTLTRRYHYAPELSPLFRLEEVRLAPTEVQTDLLVYALYDYLEFTWRLEDGPVAQVCELIVDNRLPIAVSECLCSEAAVIREEEAQHRDSYAKMRHRVEAETTLSPGGSPPAFLERLERLVAANGKELEPWIRIFFVIISETLITRQLVDLASSDEIVPHVRALVADHARDEARHHRYFRALFLELWPKMDGEHRIALARLIPAIIAAYIEPHFAPLEAALRHFPMLFDEPRRLARTAVERDLDTGLCADAIGPTLRLFESAGVFDEPLARYRLRRAMAKLTNASPRSPDASVIHSLRHSAATRPDRCAVVMVREEQERGRLTYAELDRRARSVAARLQREGLAGQRVLLLLETSIEFVAAFFGALYAGVTAVPAQVPLSYRNSERILNVARDCGAAAILTSEDRRSTLQSLLGDDAFPASRWIIVDSITDAEAEDWIAVPCDPKTPAFLQYTSGTTGSAKGVIVTHGNVMANASDQIRGMAMTPNSTIVSWLPLFHDMGLVGNLVTPLIAGAKVVLMAPLEFLARPIRWLRAIGQYRADISGGPDFAYVQCVSRIADRHIEGLDLSSWRIAFNGAEVVRSATLRAFAERFRSVGFTSSSWFPCYGLAESTLFVTGAFPGADATIRHFDAGRLEKGEVVPVDEQFVTARTRTIVSSGSCAPEVRVRIVDPVTLLESDDARVGEIWIASDSVARGYWARPDGMAMTFRAKLTSGSEREFLRTGDLGFVLDGELFVCGRLKDVIIVRGKNYLAEDFEEVIRNADSLVGNEISAAFGVDTDQGEGLVLVCELAKGSRSRSLTDLRDVLRGSIVDSIDVSPHDIVFVPRGSIPRSSSGKVQRSRCRDMYSQRVLRVLGETSERHDFEERA